ncbi:type II toxin-antitoxin system HicB family antitoxin [Candidatus Methylospira mobilis]|uniref:Type II toxin-antitoxin system HicB family antitoxin n=1 Tax=Candidatus Methylospira mobilis TaxID=1808979 RepID=A0A5Q0BT44_9GAMM|nr:type II toxin-antitoxin system HicB family antitoxin [Candidatus Methylospira mobilis]QFY44836.1 type II toxin-antitoxin system HicB family antitoxin [Candidatus Methylospira mobilis]WNV05618.1 type II toxin-antitoxin system HicB family antitoxin [Candidatus Methylospira mobilis]
MNTMTYKGYSAHIEFDERDNIFVGRVLGVSAIIGFHGETVTELRADFEAAIDFMIDDSNARGETPASGKLTQNAPPEMRVHAAALVAAQTAGKSLSQWVSDVLGEATHA